MLKRGTSLAQRLASPAVRYSTPLRRTERPASAGWWRIGDSATASHSNAQPVEDQDAKIARVEAVLFMSREPISTRKLANVAKLADGTEARTLVNLLARRYEQRGSAMQVVEVAGGIQLFTRPGIADWIRRLHGESEEIRPRRRRWKPWLWWPTGNPWSGPKSRPSGGSNAAKSSEC
jgi:hypothetical protein